MSLIGKGGLLAVSENDSSVAWELPNVTEAASELYLLDDQLIYIGVDGTCYRIAADNGAIQDTATLGEAPLSTWFKDDVLHGLSKHYRFSWDGYQLQREALADSLVAAGPGAGVSEDRRVYVRTDDGIKQHGLFPNDTTTEPLLGNSMPYLAAVSTFRWLDHKVFGCR